MVGVSYFTGGAKIKFYIYDNGSSDNLREILEPYIKSGIVEYKYFPGKKMQLFAYRDAVKRYKNKTQWMAFIDLDEFIVPTGSETIIDFLKDFDDCSQIVIPWVIYGSSGHKTTPEGLVMENYKYRAKDGHRTSHKSIVNPRNIFQVTCHSCNVAGKTLNQYKQVLCFPFFDASNRERIRINHYYCKSLESFEKRRMKGEAWNGYDNREDDFEKRDRNEVFDPIMDKYIEPVKQAIKQRRNR
ncbi:MAG: glycosyltransferase family 92 protein [Elusimicrobiota bacterium]|jgi:hypothetical protein|nr:glycosyltransferase family 92 protein [Elusimicrobiota bacterium]